jgi:hypothetical protein
MNGFIFRQHQRRHNQGNDNSARHLTAMDTCLMQRLEEKKYITTKNGLLIHFFIIRSNP